MLEYPISSGEGGAWIDPANIAEFARVAEASGLDALAFTDHPAPSKKWLDHGGHEDVRSVRRPGLRGRGHLERSGS